MPANMATSMGTITTMRASFNGKKLFATVVLATGIGLIGGGLAAYAVYARIGPGVQIINTPGNSTGGTVSVSTLARAVTPSLVLVSTKSGSTDLPTLRASSSQGFVVTSSGLVATTTFALQNGNQLLVLTSDGVAHSAVVAALDSDHGVALLRLADATGLTAVSISSSDAVGGDSVFEVGAPPPGATTVVPRYVTTLSQTSASPALSQFASMSGVPEDQLSGAPILNVSGAVAGMAGPAIDGGPTMIPAKFIQSLIRGSSSGHSTFGAKNQLLLPSAATGLGLVPGAWVQSVAAGGPASSAGLQVGDVVQAYDGTAIDASHPFDAEALSLGAGQPVTLTVWRAGQVMKLSIVVGSSSS